MFICEHKFVYIQVNSSCHFIFVSFKIIMTPALNKHITSCHLKYHVKGEWTFYLNLSLWL